MHNFYGWKYFKIIFCVISSHILTELCANELRQSWTDSFNENRNNLNYFIEHLNCLKNHRMQQNLINAVGILLWQSIKLPHSLKPLKHNRSNQLQNYLCQCLPFLDFSRPRYLNFWSKILYNSSLGVEKLLEFNQAHLESPRPWTNLKKIGAQLRNTVPNILAQFSGLSFSCWPMGQYLRIFLFHP